MAKTPRIKLVTPRGTLRYPKLNQINYGTEKYPVKDGNFETEIILDKTDPEFAVLEGKLVRVLSWYDNEWGFSNRMIELAFPGDEAGLQQRQAKLLSSFFGSTEMVVIQNSEMV